MLKLNLGLLSLLAWRNLWRYTRRTLIILMAVALGVWSMVTIAALVRGSMEQQIHTAIANLTGHIQIHAPDYRDDPVIAHRFAAPNAALRTALSQPDIIAWATRVRVPAVVSSERESAGVVMVGIEPQAEAGLSFIGRTVKRGRYLSADQDDGVLLGRKLAERLETDLGRRVVLMSQDINNEIADRGFRVVGIFEADTEASENQYVFVGRAIAQQMLKLGTQISEIAALTPDREAVAPPLARLKAASPGLVAASWRELEPLLVLSVSVIEVVLVIWFVIIFLAMSFGLVNTLLMAVFERTREIGLLQALGMRPRAILLQVLLESLFLLLAGIALGNLLAWANLAWLHDGLDLTAFARGLEMAGMSPIIYPHAADMDLITANLLVLVLGLAASLYPAWRAARYVPIEAITRT